MIGAAALWRRSLADWRPIGAVLLVVLAGEAWDVADAAFSGTRQYWAGNWKDIWNTLFWPLTLLLLARFSPILKR